MSFRDKGDTIECPKEFFENLLKRPAPCKYEDDKSFTVNEYEEKIAVPCNVKMSNQIHELIKFTLLPELDISFEEFVTERFIERMQQILTDPEEYGKLMLESVLRSHCILQNQNEIFGKVVSIARKDEEVIRK